MGTVRRRPQSSQAGVHLAVGLLVGGLLGATAGLLAGVRQYIESNAVITEPGAHHAADQPQLSSGGEGDPADEDCASDPRVAWPLLGLVAGAIFGVSTAQGYHQVFRLLRGRGWRRVASPTSKVIGR
jgi:hypothetical protein